MTLRGRIRQKLVNVVRDGVLSTMSPDVLSRVVDEAVERRVNEVVHREVERLGTTMRRDLYFGHDIEAVRTSSALLDDRLGDAIAHWDPIQTLEAALDAAPPSGLALEFGVFEGRTLRVIAGRRSRGTVFGFDSFDGLPETWRSGFSKGVFATDQTPEVEGAELVIGWFDQVLEGFLAAHPEPVGFLHVDCDLYSSTVTVLEHVGPRLEVGSIVQFDEYFNYPGWEHGEFLAWEEYAARTGTQFEYLGYTANNEQVAVRITGLG